MADKVTLRIDKREIDAFLSYSIDADLYTADDAFKLEIADPGTPIADGARCELWINGRRELTGIVDRITESYSKQGSSLILEGRDLCGLLVDSCCEEFVGVQGMTLKTLAERLIRTVPFIQRKDIIYQETVRGNLKKKKGGGGSLAVLGLVDTAQNFTQIEPGQTIFEVLKIYAASRGMMFFAMPDGTFVFGKPKEGGEPTFHLVAKKRATSPENNAMEGTRTRDISRRFSKIIVVGQQQGTDIMGTGADGAAQINTLAVVPDPTFPFYKPYVATDNNDERSPKLHGQMLLEQMKHDGFRLEYRVSGHSQNGTNWAINKICRVTDERFGIDGDYLIYGRAFEMSKDSGVTTRLTLGYPGMVV